MKLYVKVLRGDGCVTEVNDETTILDIKKQIEIELNVPVAQQTLVYLGRTLIDEKNIGSYTKIKDGAKLHLVIKKPESLQAVLDRFLRKYYNEEQTALIMEEFIKDFNAKVDSLSLDDLERIATSYLSEESV